MKKIILISLATFFTICAHADENITITTYYPSPSGSYLDMNVQGTLLVGTGTPATSVASPRIEFTHDASASNKHWNIDQNSSNTANPKLRFFTESNSNTSTVEKLVIDANGDVGIGTNDPRAKLDVNGGIKLGATSSACNSNTRGTIRYNSGTIEYCNASNTWVTMGGTQVARGNCSTATGGTCSASCPSGYTIVTGGGCMGTQGPIHCSISASYPTNSGWVCGGACSNAMFNINGYVICAK